MTEQETRDFLQILCQMAGRLTGEGTDHNGTSFEAQLHLRPLLGRQAVATEFATQTPQGHVLHHEQSTIGFDSDGRLQMWVVSAANPRVHPMPLDALNLHSNGDLAAHFRSIQGTESEQATLRTEIQIVLKPGGSLDLTHAWGLPGQPLSPRSQVRLAMDLIDA